MKALKNKLIEHEKESNFIVWVLGVAVAKDAFDQTLAQQREKIVQLNNQALFSSKSGSQLKKIGEKLLNEKQNLQPKLSEICDEHHKLIKLFEEYDDLKREREQLLNQLSTANHDLKDKLAIEINRMRRAN